MDEEELLTKLTDGDDSERAEAAKELGLMGYNKAVESLIKALKDQVDTVRANAALALGHIGDTKALKALEDVLDDESWQVRHDALSSLARLGFPVDGIIPSLEDDIPEVRVKAVETLGTIGGKKALKAVLNHMDSEGVSDHMAEALESIGGEDTIEPLKTLYMDGDHSIREIAIRALGKIENDMVKEILIDALKDSSWRVREEAIKGLGRIGDKDIQPHLHDCLESDNVYVVESALNSIAAIGEGADLSTLEEMLDHDEPSIRAAAAKAIGAVGGKEAEDILLSTLLDRTHPVVMWSIVESLGNLAKQQDTSKIRTAMRSSSNEQKYMLALALVIAGDDMGVKPLLDCMVHESWKFRQKAAEGLSEIPLMELSQNKLDKVFRAMLSAMEDNDRWVRAAAVSFLGDILKEEPLKDYHEKANSALKNRLKQEIDEDVRSALEKAFSD